MVNDSLIRHVTYGWFGFVEILKAASIEGVKLPLEDIKKLEATALSLKETIDKQKELNGIVEG